MDVVLGSGALEKGLKDGYGLNRPALEFGVQGDQTSWFSVQSSRFRLRISGFTV